MFADIYRDQSDRMTPVAAVPAHTPDEAIAELDHAVDALGIETAEDLRPLFEPNFYFGREADDPLVALGFDAGMNREFFTGTVVEDAAARLLD